MSASITKRLLSNSTNGRKIVITATASAGTAIHAAITGTNDFDEVWLWGVNTATTDQEIVLEYGGTSSGDRIPYTIPARDGLHLLIPGLPLNGGVTTRAYTTVTENIGIVGFVNRITATATA